MHALLTILQARKQFCLSHLLSLAHLRAQNLPAPAYQEQ